MLSLVRPRRPRASVTAIGFVALVSSLLVSPGLPFGQRPARTLTPPLQVGTTFTPWRAEALGLDPKSSFAELLQMHFAIIRLAARWDQVDSRGYSQLDMLMGMAAAAHQPVVLEVGVKSLGWPEFYPPPGLVSGVDDGGDVGSAAALRAPLLAYVQETVLRYRANPVLVAWQVENEPFNAAGPHRWWLDAALVGAEMKLVRSLDRRPLILNAFTHFNAIFDRVSEAGGLSLAGLLGFQSNGAESQSLDTLDAGDVLGLDVYTRIGYRLLGQDGLSVADSDWASRAGDWLERAQSQGSDAWVTEAQAEPWEASRATSAHPVSLRPVDLATMVDSLRGAGFTTVLLWGSEYWLWREAHGDRTWLEAVKEIQQSAARPGIQPGWPRHR